MPARLEYCAYSSGRHNTPETNHIKVVLNFEFRSFELDYMRQSLRQRTEKPFALVLAFRLTVELVEFRLRFKALVLLWIDDQKFVSVPLLLNHGEGVLRLPANKPPAVKIII